MISQPKKKKLNPMLMKVLLISVGVHVLALVLLGSYVVVRAVIPDDAQFEEPPVIVEEVPPPEIKIEIKPQSQPMQNKLKMRPVANIAVANVNVDLPSMDQSFTVSAGLGGFGGGSLLGGTSGSIGLGMSDVSVFGLKTRAERLLFVIDANRRMVMDNKGGLNSYKVIKDEITDMVGNLSAGTLYNVMLYDQYNVKLFKPNLTPAGQESHQQLMKWLAPINSDVNKLGVPGSRQAQISALSDTDVYKGILTYRNGGNTNIFITQVALEQSVDAIFMITGYHRGIETARRAMTEKEAAKDKAHREKILASRDYQQQMEEHQKEVPEMVKRVAAELAKINKERKDKGQPPRVLSSGHNVYYRAKDLGLKWKTPSINISTPMFFLEPRKVATYYRDLIKAIYTDKGGNKPSVNVVLFLAGDEKFTPEWEKSLDDYVRLFSGKSRIIRGLDEIKDARTATETKN